MGFDSVRNCTGERGVLERGLEGVDHLLDRQLRLQRSHAGRARTRVGVDEHHDDAGLRVRHRVGEQRVGPQGAVVRIGRRGLESGEGQLPRVAGAEVCELAEQPRSPARLAEVVDGGRRSTRVVGEWGVGDLAGGGGRRRACAGFLCLRVGVADEGERRQGSGDRQAGPGDVPARPPQGGQRSRSRISPSRSAGSTSDTASCSSVLSSGSSITWSITGHLRSAVRRGGSAGSRRRARRAP